MSRRLIALSAVLFVALVFPSRPVAQSKPTLKPADYDQFETVKERHIGEHHGEIGGKTRHALFSSQFVVMT